MEKRVIETEKLGNVYKNFVNDLPEFVERYKKFINDSKDEVIAKLEQDQSTDENVKAAREVELKRLEIQEKMVSELPKLRDQLTAAFEAIEERMTVMQPRITTNYQSQRTYVPHYLGVSLLSRQQRDEEDSRDFASVNTPCDRIRVDRRQPHALLHPRLDRSRHLAGRPGVAASNFFALSVTIFSPESRFGLRKQTFRVPTLVGSLRLRNHPTKVGILNTCRDKLSKRNVVTVDDGSQSRLTVR